MAKPYSENFSSPMEESRFKMVNKAADSVENFFLRKIDIQTKLIMKNENLNDDNKAITISEMVKEFFNEYRTLINSLYQDYWKEYFDE